jgi:hypothetical protein
MEKELSYLSPEGFTVFTSKFLKNRGTCCKSACLHCPYGFTIKKLGIQFEVVTENNSDLIAEILNENNKADFDWRSFLPDHVLLIKLKGSVAGFLVKSPIVIKQMFLRNQFQHQDIYRELVESYLFV